MPRTGTQSLQKALKQLGITCCHYPHTLPQIKGYRAACEVKHDIVQCEKVWPGSLYIMTVRNQDDWLRSCQAHVNKRQKRWNPFWFESPAMWPQLYRRRLYEVLDTIPASRLLVFNLCDFPEWEPLCNFLGVDVPDVPFPHLNKSKK